jgi:hypothetical protein
MQVMTSRVVSVVQRGPVVVVEPLVLDELWVRLVAAYTRDQVALLAGVSL